MQATYIPASSDFAIYGHKLRALLLLVTHSLRRQAYGRVCSPVRAGHGLLRIWGLSPTWITFFPAIVCCDPERELLDALVKGG